MIQYPKIPFTVEHSKPQCVGFIKYDGTNIGTEWTSTGGFTKFTFRKRLLDPADPTFGPVAAHIRNRWEPLSQRLRTLGFGRVSVFGEYWSPETFAGNHENLQNPDARVWTPFDIYLHDRERFLGPERFIEVMDGLPAAQVVFRGKFTGQIGDNVRHGKLGPCVVEGVIFKGEHKGVPWAFKVKTDAYLTRLQGVFGRDWQQHV